MTEKQQYYRSDPRFAGVEPFDMPIPLSSPTMHGDELVWVQDAIQKNWVTTIGENIDTIERAVAERVGRRYAVALSSGTSALHLAIRLAGERLYGRPAVGHGTLEGKRVFCSDMTFDATVNPVAYEGGEAVFIDTDPRDWNIDVRALKRAFERFPDVRLIVLAHLYGTPCDMDAIRDLARAHGALIVEDAAESLGASYRGTAAGALGDYSIISFNGNKIITGSSGGMFLTDREEDAQRVRKWSTQSREAAPWYQHVELGYNYRMSNVVAGVIRGQLPHLQEHLSGKAAVYERYREGFQDLPVSMNPIPKGLVANHWLSCILIDEAAMCRMDRTDTVVTFTKEAGKSCPTEILEALAAFGAEGRPVWKPMHLQPMYAQHAFVAREDGMDVGRDLFHRGLCLPSDNKLTKAQQERIIDIVRRCFL